MKQPAVYYGENRNFKFTGQLYKIRKRSYDSFQSPQWNLPENLPDWGVMDWEPGAFTELQDQTRAV